MTETKDRIWLAAYTKLLEAKLQWGPVSQWSQRDFESLSELLLAQTGVLISVTTLKRALGRVAFQGMPLQTTLNALVQYIGYPDWAHFKSHPELLEQLEVQPSTTVKPTNRRAFLLTSLGIGLLVMLLATYFYFKPQIQILQGPTAFLHASDARGDSAPHTVHFEYLVPKQYHKDVILISFGDHSGISYANYDGSGKGTIKHTFTEEGFYPVKLFANKTELAKIPVIISSGYWLMSIGNINQKVPTQSVINQGILTLKPSALSKIKHDTTERIYTSFKTCRDFRVNADSFKLRTRLRVLPSAYNAHLPKVQLRLGTLGGAIKLTLDKSETSRDIYNQFSDFIVPIAEQKKFFTQDVSDWALLELSVVDRQFQIRVNDKMIYEGRYEKPLNHLYSVTLDFRGIGEVDFIKLYNSVDRLVFQEEF